MFKFILTLFIYLYINSIHASSSSSSSLNIASIQYAVQGNTSYLSYNNNIQLNLNSYLNYINMISMKNINIIIFPEGTLGWLLAVDRISVINYCENIPNVYDDIIPCDNNVNYLSPLQQLSCAAVKYNITISFNTCDKQPCTGNTCNIDGFYLRNTEVVLDNRGKVIAKYYKAHLFGESGLFDSVPPSMNNISTAQFQYTNGEFSTTIGLFTCFDIEFNWPAKYLHAKPYNIDFFLMSSDWMNTPPLMNAISMQQAWSRTYNSLLVASNSGTPAQGGGGIYLNGNALADFYNPGSNFDQILFSSIPITSYYESINKESVIEKEIMPLITESIATDTVECYIGGFLNGKCLAVGNALNTTIQVSSNFSCNFNAAVSQNLSPSNILYAFATDTYLNFPNTPNRLHFQVCALTTCINPSFSSIGLSCGYDSVSASAELSSFSIQANFSSGLVLPLVLIDGAQIIPDATKAFDFSTVDNQQSSMSSSQFYQPLFTATLVSILQDQE